MISSYNEVICGDSDIVIDRLIEKGIKFDLILTDPPYNLNKDFGNDSDKMSVDEYISITKKRIIKLKKLLTPNGSIIWFGIHNYICYVQIAMYEAGLFYRRMNIWHYENGFSRTKREPSTHYEPFLWFSNNNKQWTYNCDEVRVPYKSTDRLRSPIKYKGKDNEIKIWSPNPKGALRGDIWNYPTLAGAAFKNERTEHPTQKPESLITEIIKAFCPIKGGHYEGAILDPFFGSGTLGVCCEKLNTQGNFISWMGIEIEKKWCDIAKKRLRLVDNT